MTPKQFAGRYRKHGSIRKVQAALGDNAPSYHVLNDLYKKAITEGFIGPTPMGAPKGNTNARSRKCSINSVEDFLSAFAQHGSLSAVMRSEGYHPGTKSGPIRRYYREAVERGLINQVPAGSKSREQMKDPLPAVDGRVHAMPTQRLRTPGRGIRRFLFTAAQNNTRLHEGFWNNLMAFRDYYDAELMVARFTYKKEAYGSKSVKPGKGPTREDTKGLWYDERLDNYIRDDRVEVAPGLVWCGEFNRLPTAIHPMSGFETYTGRKSGIFPHVKVEMQSVASMRHEPTKFNYSTGAVTQRNYIQKATGIRAEFHHCYGALLVEVDSDGDWFCRQIIGDSEGTFYDLDVRVMDGQVTIGHRAEAILWGDVHVAQIDPVVKALAWNHGGMLDVLRPREQHMGDVLDFRGRSHHEMKDPHLMFRRHVQGIEDVRREVADTGAFLEWSRRPWCKTVVIDSNHHDHLGRWLKEQDGRRDPVNAEFWFAMQSRVYDGIRDGGNVNYFVEALKEAGHKRITRGIRFLDRDESYIICHDAQGGIECGLHGHDGPGGERGSTRAYTKMGRRVNKAHDHTATIMDGVYSAGTCSILTPDWSHGPGGWSHSHIVTYPNGKRAIYTMFNGKWRASA